VLFSTSVLAGSTAPDLFPDDHNDRLVVAEACLGGYHGQVDIDRLQSLVELVRTRRHSRSHQKGKSTSVLLGSPRVLASLSLAQGHFRIGELTSDIVSVAADDDTFRSSSGRKPSGTFCCSLPAFNLSIETRYVDLIHKYSDAQRRKIRRFLRRGSRASQVPRVLEGVMYPQTFSTEDNSSPDVDSVPTQTSPDPDDKTPSFVGTPATSTGSFLRTSAFNINAHDQHTFSYQVDVSFSTTGLDGYLLSTGSSSYDPLSPAERDTSLDEHVAQSNSPERTSQSVRHDICSLGPSAGTFVAELLGCESDAPGSVSVPTVDIQARAGVFNIAVGAGQVALWEPNVLDVIRQILERFVDEPVSPAVVPDSVNEPENSVTETPRPVVDVLPHNIFVNASIASIDIELAVPDPKADHTVSRGAAFRSSQVICEYLLQTSPRTSFVFAARQHLDLSEDIALQAESLRTQDPIKKCALFKLTSSEVRIEPVVDATRARRAFCSGSIDVKDKVPSSDWELKNRASMIEFIKRPPRSQRKRLSGDVVLLPHIVLRITIAASDNSADSDPQRPTDTISIATESDRLTGRLDVFRLYCVLLAGSVFRNLSPRHGAHPPKYATPFSTQRRRSPAISIRIEVIDAHFIVTLPGDVRLFLQTRRLELQMATLTRAAIVFDAALLAGESPTVPGHWDDIIRLRAFNAFATPSPSPTKWKDPVICIEAQAGRIRIPYGYHLYTIIDNTATMVKTMKQLVHRLIKGGNDWIIEPHAEKPKRVPHINISIQILALEMVDDPLETALNRIWRVGREEQKGRLARDRAFDRKLESIEKAAHEGPQGHEHGQEGGDMEQKSFHHLANISEAREALSRFNARNWIGRVRNAKAEQRRREEGLIRQIYGRPSSSRPDADLPIDLINVVPTAPLFRATFNSVAIEITKPSFGEDGLADFLHNVGKGLPRDTRFSLLIPFHLSWAMNEARITLRDYPLPLLHIPPPHQGQDDVNSWQLESDIVIAEELADSPSSIRRVPCVVIPAEQGRRGHTILVPRSAMPTKTYALPRVNVVSSHATRIGWGNSIQPTIQDVARIFDTITKPSPDPSERIGFWDKVRLILHGNVEIYFPGNSQVHLHLKGERDPYSITGKGAGFCMCWRDDVRILLGFNNKDREFLQVESDEFILGIPDLRDYEDNAATGLAKDMTDGDDKSVRSSVPYPDSHTTSRRYQRDAMFIKVSAKLINGVRWGMGIVLERSCRPGQSMCGCTGPPFRRQCRFFDFIPHWNVKTRTKDGLKDPGSVSNTISCPTRHLADDGYQHDSFAGFRSDFIHFSLSITSPRERVGINELHGEEPPLIGYNSLHLSPESATHFWAWWSLFNSALSLPIRHGPLFPSATPPSKKFGRHCATLKYRFSIAPFFVAHTYCQEDFAEWRKGEAWVIGIKCKIGRFHIDMHQRAQEEVTRRSGMDISKRALHKRFYQAEVDCAEVDLRVVSARFSEPERRFVVPEREGDDHKGVDVPLQEEEPIGPDAELDWIDHDDYVDMTSTFRDVDPVVRVLPVLSSPRFTYYRQPSNGERPRNADDDVSSPLEPDASASGVAPIITKFGSENTHTCLIGQATGSYLFPFHDQPLITRRIDTIDVQIEMAQKRLQELKRESSEAFHRSSDDVRRFPSLVVRL
jgi:RNA pol II promoter Fmp27 protein domain/Domain of unknown function (DUF2405)